MDEQPVKLNHLNFTVIDVKSSVDFLVKHFGLQIGNTRGNAFVALFDDDDDGFDAEPPQRSHGWTFYVQASGRFTVEVLS